MTEIEELNINAQHRYGKNYEELNDTQKVVCHVTMHML